MECVFLRMIWLFRIRFYPEQVQSKRYPTNHPPVSCLFQQKVSRQHDPADAEPAADPEQEGSGGPGVPERRQAPLQEPLGEAEGQHILL